ncbi:hypothetical protein [Hymenobacter cellulosivorans]|uniref:STAS/SEC14 domain-containing protein n=1 Tax=Hymenobacter cellulosivorans TaxID=2932249 RepID=A0ABY4FFX2_9BACT|nr:hypothetical protein [Hymenobacter cellulosivorans]UOQ55408.1 hypothetical protein MUN80_11775 [Hymenobacter cellulosivorans]
MSEQTTPRLYFENPVGRLLEHPDGYAIVAYNPGKRKLSDMQAFLTHASQLLRNRGWRKMLGDQQQMSPYTEDERTWIQNYWVSRTAQGDEIYGAVILPQDVFARLSVNLVMNEAQESALTYRLFDNEADAKVWLTQLPV